MPLGKLTLLVFLLAAAPAHAATYCVGDVDCPAGGIEVATWQEARSAGAANPGTDTYLLGSGTFAAPIHVPSGDRLVGSGRGKTFIAGGAAGLLTSVLDASMSDVTLVMDDEHTLGTDAEGGTLERVDIDGSALTQAGTGVLGRSTTYRQGRIALAHGIAIDNGVDGEDLVIEAPVGFYEGDHGGSLRRTIIRAERGVEATGQGVTIDDSVVHVHGDAPVGLRSAGSEFAPGLATITARNVTIAGPGGGVGVDVEGGCPRRFAGGSLDQVAITGFEVHIQRRYLEFGECDERVPEEVNVHVRRSAFDPDRVVDEGGHGAIVMGDASPIATDLKLIDAAGGDLRPRWDSPLIDAGTEASEADVRGLPRVGRPDVGAYEYQFAAPVAHAAVTPKEGRPGDTFVFDARASTDVDGDPLTFAWTFSRGDAAHGAVVERALGAGAHTATVTVTDPTGRSSSAGVTATAQPPAAAPAPPTVGPPAARPPAAGPPAARPPARGRAGRAAPRRMTVRARRARGAGLRYRLSGSIDLPRGVEASRCAGGHVVVRVPTRRGRDRERYARVGADCRFSMTVTIPRRYRGGFVRLHPLFRGGTDLAPVHGRVVIRPR